MVEKGDFDKYLAGRYADQVKWYDEKSIHNKKLANISQISVIILAAVTPIFAALEMKWPTIVSSALITAIIGISRYYKFEELWHNYRAICEILKKEKYLYEFKADIYKDANDPEKLFIERFESIISKENIEWLTIIKKDRDTTCTSSEKADIRE